MIIGGRTSAAVSAAATSVLAIAICQRGTGLRSWKISVPSSISEPSAAVPMTSATSGSTVRMTSVSRTSAESGRPPPIRIRISDEDRQRPEQTDQQRPSSAEEGLPGHPDQRQERRHRRTR